MLYKSRNLFKRSIYASIINNIKDTDQFYQFLNADDPAVARALSIIKAGEAFPQVSEDVTKTTAHE